MLPGSRSFLHCPRAIPPGRNPSALPFPVVFITVKSCSAYTALPWPHGLKISEYPDLNLLKYFFPPCSPPLALPSSIPFLLPPQLPQTSSPLQTPSAATAAPFPSLRNSGTCCVCPISRRPSSFRKTHHPRALLQCPQARRTHHEEGAPLPSFPAQGRVQFPGHSAGCCRRGAGLWAVPAKGRSARGGSPRGARRWLRDRQTDRQTRSGGSTSPATPILCLRVKRAETAVASSALKLSRSAFLSDTHPSRGGKCKRKNSSVGSLPTFNYFASWSQTTPSAFSREKKNTCSPI